MAFRVYKGKTQVNYFAKGDTTIRIVVGSAVKVGATGKLLNLANDSDDRIIGVSQKLVATGDSADLVPVVMASEDVVFEVETDSDGGAAASDVGRFVAIDTGDTTNPNATVDISDSGIPHFMITEIVSATKVRGYFGRVALRQPQGDAYDS